MYDFGLIGNCQISAMVDPQAVVRWLCMPRLDSPPVFGSLLDPAGGQFSATPVTYERSRQYYKKNTNILITEFDTGDGQLQVTDFCPRFEQHGRMYRPAAMFRIITPIGGRQQVTISCKPVNGWAKEQIAPQRANSHLRFPLAGGVLRVVTNMPLTYLLSDAPCSVLEPVYVALLWDMPLEADIEQTTLDFLDKTDRYWQRWVKHCTIPPYFQEEVIRSALVLKLHCYEDTGAIIAATTTSLPEQVGGVRNWDYRFCWLRDAFFTLSAFHNLGHFEEMEGFLRFILEIVNYRDDLAPVYCIDRTLPLPEREHPEWAGFQGSAPVRSNNAAAEQVQNDSYGELILTLVPIYLDERFYHLRSPQLDRTMHWLADRCCELVGQPDAGLWELRGIKIEHSFTNLMCWAGIDRVLAVISSGNLKPEQPNTVSRYELAREHAVSRLQAATKDGVVANSPGGDRTLDASLLMLPMLRFGQSDVALRTVQAIAAELGASPEDGEDAEHLLFRYRRDDDFGAPKDAFMICSFWLAHAYASLGRTDAAAVSLKALCRCANSLGIYSEHFSPSTREQSGNYPQTYSHVGLVNAAFALSPRWSDIL